MLKYVGDGASVIGIPARDLSGEEVEQYGEELLLSTRLYVRTDATKPKVKETSGKPTK